MAKKDYRRDEQKKFSLFIQLCTYKPLIPVILRKWRLPKEICKKKAESFSDPAFVL